jgi:hypothetical protein
VNPHRPPSRSRLLLATLLVVVLSATAAPAASLLEGAVLGAADDPKPYVRVEVSGPRHMTFFTDKDGKFSLPLETGRYTVVISEANRINTFPLELRAGEAKVTRTFKLSW